jgi:hypothetical protein
MKWFSIIPVLALVFLAGACEKHPASELPEEGATAFGEHAKAAGEEKPEAKPAGESAAPAKPESPAPATDSKSGDAPKFFPANK